MMRKLLTPENYRDVGPFLAVRRAMKGLKQQDVARRAGVTSACVSAIEAGTNAGRLSSVVAIAAALGLEIEIREKTPF